MSGMREPRLAEYTWRRKNRSNGAALLNNACAGINSRIRRCKVPFRLLLDWLFAAAYHQRG